MPGQCIPQDIPKVEAILEAVDTLDREKLIETIKQCARETDLVEGKLRSSLGKISGITPDDITRIVPAIPTSPPAPGSGTGSGAGTGTPGAAEGTGSAAAQAASGAQPPRPRPRPPPGPTGASRTSLFDDIENPETQINLRPRPPPRPPLERASSSLPIATEINKRRGRLGYDENSDDDDDDDFEGGKRKSKKNKSKKSKTKKNKSKKSKSKKRRSKRRKHRKMRRTRR